MRLLLDTHIWIWYLKGSDRLANEIHELIEDPENDVFLSPISVWETLILAERGRLDLQPDPETWVRDAMQVFPTIEAPVNTEVAIESRSIALPHTDPADRFLAATASIYKAALLTLDRRLIESTAVKTYPG